ncbi:MAG: prepilin-type N-terminal cleavage/methylation domain-containing protein [Candidatus Omnitrophica bacterium]|nr:prepilin-type N-terminal cleavage/methylation domain-containing protein [Candidatus Omnitrophota bacterium]MBU2043793.1 prepilin-type N-terminal cleavage/methylation domain-containing protein [Candidatus Omnitrophota bacterium]MBU2251042.1 prepilin-type N-terminal cleavage/methylation domain-containing protein [Candidatus Omnitrophota bacterium]MBU2473349.1 prepilin-type N-terminal cleavage/methylation domain-containing protein [Candidatus Omnitrophota bacterium]
MINMKKTFTLIELIVVIAIIAILAAIIAPNAFKAIEKAKIAKLIGEGKAYKTALLSLYADTGHWPGDGHSGSGGIRVMALFDASLIPGWMAPYACPSNLLQDDDGWSGWDGPYVEKLVGKNPWGGYYALQRHSLLNSPYDQYIFLNINGLCYGDLLTSTTYDCGIPIGAGRNIDEKIDDNDPTWEKGLFYRHNIEEWNTYLWFLTPTS